MSEEQDRTADEKKESLRASFPPNSRTTIRDSSKNDTVINKKTEKVVNGLVKRQKRSFGRKIADSFLEDDTKSVGSYVLHDILIPAAKAMISDMVSGGIEMLLFGDRSRSSRKSSYGYGRGYTGYGAFSRSYERDKIQDPRDRPREMSRTGRARHDFDEIILETRGEAEEVLALLADLTIDYNQATVADLYDLVGITSDYTDRKYGWYDLKGAEPRRVREGYLLDLPRPVALD